MSEPVKKVRPFLWSMRREVWENPAIWMAPLAIEGVVLLAQVFAVLHRPGEVTRAAAAGSAKAVQSLNMPYAAAAGAVFVISFLVSLCYCAGALHGERRDRSILFWKSLPVSDLTAVLAKAAVPLVLLPAVMLAVVAAGQLAALALTTLAVMLAGLDPRELWSRLHMGFMWAAFGRSMIIMPLWYAPLVAWLLLVGLVGARFEQRVLRKLLGEEGVELEVRQLQQLDGLPKLGRQDQLLRLADA